LRDLLDPDDYDFYLVKELIFLFPSFEALVFPLFLCFDGVLAIYFEFFYLSLFICKFSILCAFVYFTTF